MTGTKKPINDGGPAFSSGNPTHGGHPGMSLRDYYAGQVLSKMLTQVTQDEMKARAKYCFEMADAMLAARDFGFK